MLRSIDENVKNDNFEDVNRRFIKEKQEKRDFTPKYCGLAAKDAPTGNPQRCPVGAAAETREREERTNRKNTPGISENLGFEQLKIMGFV